jgi:predicted TIM-barrel fold metal-dependent hydrolase
MAALPHAARAQALPDIPDCFIDAHCHVFDGKDVPAGQFVLLVAMREKDMAQYAPVAEFFVRILRDFAPTYDQEMGSSASASMTDEEFRRHVFDTLMDMSNDVRTSPTPIAATLFNDMRKAGLEIEGDALRIDGQYASVEALAIARLEQNYYATPALSSDPRSTLKLPQPTRSAIEAFLPGSSVAARTDRVTRLTESIVDDVKKFFAGVTSIYGELRAYMGILRIFLSYRRENILRLDSLYGPPKPSVLRLYCASIIDFDVWLGQTGDTVSTPVPKQAALMAKIARNTPTNVLMHGFVPFDPLRAIVEQSDSGTTYKDHVTSLGRLIEEHGMIGFKLYPPMGFRAWGNAGSNQTYVTAKYDVVSKLIERLNISEAELSRRLDQALDEFYLYCLAHHLPILTHCSNSQTAFEGSGERSSPMYWRDLLKRSGYSNLRVNLGHSGGVWCRVEMDTNPAMKPNERARCEKEIGWFKEIIDIVTATKDGEWAYPNVSFDIADILTLNNDNRRKLLIPQMREAMGESTECKGRRARERILYGTDWMFLAFDADYRKFLDGAKTLARDLPVDPKDLFWRNAADFMGLVKSTGVTRDRLRRFYKGDDVRQNAVERLSIDARTSVQCT